MSLIASRLESIPVRCQHAGDTVGGSSNWYYISDGTHLGWIPAAYLSVDLSWSVAIC